LAETQAASERQIAQRADFGIIRYANLWEDADVLVAALEPAAGKRFLSIASAGDNALALAAEGAEVVAADLSAAQLACVELRLAAIKRLDYEDVLAFFGVVTPEPHNGQPKGGEPKRDDRRATTYRQLRSELSAGARDFWDAHEGEIAGGFIHSGKFESYFRLFRRRVLPLVHGRRRIDELLSEKSLEARRAFYERVWNNRRWRWMFRIFFSRTVMGRKGRDPEFFRYVEGSVSDRILERTRYALTELPTHTNPYLRYILTGNYDPACALPRYLRPENFAKVREGAGRVTLYHGPIDAAAGELAGPGWDGFNLSDIFEYLGPGLSRDVYGKLLAHSRPGARFTYWNMLVPRRRPEEFAARVRSLDTLAAEQFARDTAFFYSALVVEEVV
jgi:S-adenosylmethionine-diacylglycerol 3-amino-3-carboxypropyl transferase